MAAAAARCSWRMEQCGRTATRKNRQSKRSSLQAARFRKTNASASASTSGGTSAADAVDWYAVRKYTGAAAFQLGAFAACAAALDGISSLMMATGVDVPVLYKQWLIGALGAFLSIRSRWLNPLDNRRPSAASETQAKREARRPAWTPPGPVFGIVWTAIAVLRGIAFSYAWVACNQCLLSWPLYMYYTHLTIGDVWNHINVHERRYGVSTLGMLFVVPSAVAVCLSYYTVSPTAAFLLVPKVLWLCVAAVLVAQIRQLNGSPPLLPRVSERLA